MTGTGYFFLEHFLKMLPSSIGARPYGDMTFGHWVSS